jgi:hypothetical protein
MQSGGILIPPFVVRIFKSTVFLQIYVPLTLTEEDKRRILHDNAMELLAQGRAAT